jgi:Tol biopolymer transport system component
MRERYELFPGFTFAKRIRAPHRLAYLEKRDLVVRDLRTGRRRAVYDDGRWQVACPIAWSPDGRTLFHGHYQLVALDVRSGEDRAITSFRKNERASIMWCLSCSPDGKRLAFLQHVRPRACIGLVKTDGSDFRIVVDLTGPSHFVCDWRRNFLLVAVARPPALWRYDLDGGDARCIAEGSWVHDLQIAPDGEHALYELQSRLWWLDLATGEARAVVDRGRRPALSPDGSAVAFVRDDHDVYVQHLDGTDAMCLLRATDSQQPWRSSFAQRPAWSPDGRLLWFSSTISHRFDQPLHPKFVADMRRKQAAAKRRPASDVHVDYEGSIELAHWKFEHTTGIADLDARTVWKTNGYWSQVAWAP